MNPTAKALIEAAKIRRLDRAMRLTDRLTDENLALRLAISAGDMQRARDVVRMIEQEQSE